MSRRDRVAPPSLLAAALVPLLALSACTPASEDGFEEEPPAATAADADTGAGSAIETGAAQAEISDVPGARAASVDAPGEVPCDTGPVQSLIGTPGSEAVYASAVEASGAQSHRALGPTDMATMDFSPERLNIDLDESGRITGFRCG